MWDLNYFKYCFLRTTSVAYDEVALEHDFKRFAEDLVACATASKHVTFLYRDFQARNVMLKDGEPYFIDYQGGMKGPLHYDIASFGKPPRVMLMTCAKRWWRCILTHLRS